MTLRRAMEDGSDGHLPPSHRPLQPCPPPIPAVYPFLFRYDSVMSLASQRVGLEHLGFRIVEATEDTLAATVKRFHWDCVFTRTTYVIFVRKVSELTPAMLEADRRELQSRAKQLDPSLLPDGLQKGIAVIVCYIADRVTAEARATCEREPKARFAFFYVPAVLPGQRLLTGPSAAPGRAPRTTRRIAAAAPRGPCRARSARAPARARTARTPAPAPSPAAPSRA